MKTNIYRTNKKGSKEFKTYWNIYPLLLKKIKLKKNEKILDAGCGEGKLLRYLKGDNIYGLDSSEDAVKKAKKKSYRKVVRSEIYKTPFKSKKFDKTLSIGVFQYLEDPNKAFKELLRITKKEIIITVSNFNWFKIKMLFSKKWREIYGKELKLHSNFTNYKFLKDLAKKSNINKPKIFFISSKFGSIRNLFGNHFASEVVGIFKLK